MSEETNNYNDLFNQFEKNCERENIPNAFRYIQYYELEELNNLLDKVILFVDNIDSDELEDYECGDDIIKLYELAQTLFDRDIQLFGAASVDGEHIRSDVGESAIKNHVMQRFMRKE